MNYYTETIPYPLAEKLKEKGMSIEMQPLYAQEAPNARGIVKAGVVLRCPSYAEVFDWLLGRGIHICIESDWDFETQIVTKLACDFNIEKVGMRPIYVDCPTWHEAANAAIEKALELI